jgi:hypothetical protein
MLRKTDTEITGKIYGYLEVFKKGNALKFGASWQHVSRTNQFKSIQTCMKYYKAFYGNLFEIKVARL